ncbi:NAD-dependent deacylase [Pseudooceanicola algae]|uniref:NAD-dependent protein deacylase n=1 Tax=Pseudooceanicola algae TaxID=1537215 RepID=A0A418SI14_9RHOB|nr:NAD-dependent deacylase [Pseudooceanicola algae]QPM92111.1 NAD-dependent protein deacylase [Pseudooceanicola algae]
MERIVILTGAGISAESGLATFRAADGLWENHRVEDVASPEGFARDPALVQRFYNDRRRAAAAARPNVAHEALARLQRDYPGEVTIVTQNVDALHEAAGAEVLHMHGAVNSALCAACGHRWPAPEQMQPGEACPACQAPKARPDIVWFGEMPYYIDEIERKLSNCSYFVSIGTSGNVYPAAGFFRLADSVGAHTLELNLEASHSASQFAEARQGSATELVPAWVDDMLAEVS